MKLFSGRLTRESSRMSKEFKWRYLIAPKSAENRVEVSFESWGRDWRIALRDKLSLAFRLARLRKVSLALFSKVLNILSLLTIEMPMSLTTNRSPW